VSEPTCSVLIPSFGRPEALSCCLSALAGQTVSPRQVIVVWQADDDPTRRVAEAWKERFGGRLEIVHSRARGVVPAENRALTAASGDIVLLIDDDARAPSDWVERHANHYADPTVGAVGGPADNFEPDGTPFPKRAQTPMGKLTWFGKMYGNMYDQPAEWRSKAPVEVHHLVGYNMSLRRSAFGSFEGGLRPYWQMFELEACLQVRARGYRVLFDFSNVVTHHPTNTVYVQGRQGDLTTKVYHAAYNHAYVLAKHSPRLLRAVRLLFLLTVGSTSSPGLAGSAAAVRRFGSPGRELQILRNTWRAHVAGWRAGVRRRGGTEGSAGEPAAREVLEVSSK